MTDRQTTPVPVPVPPELLAQAAAVLGVSATPSSAATGRPGSTLMVNVHGPDTRTLMTVPTDVPVGQLAGSLGAAVDVPVIARITLRGAPVSPDQTLADLGVRAGAVLTVEAPAGRRLTSLPTGDPPPAATNAALPAPPRTPPTTYARPAGGAMTRTAGRTPLSWTALVGGAVVVIVVAVFLGAALFGGSSRATSTTPPGAQQLAASAANAWVTGGPFTGPREATVPANLGRTGPAGAGVVTEAGVSVKGAISSWLFIVRTGGSTGPSSSYGLAVVIYKGQLAYPPTPTPLPFANTSPPGGAPTVPQNGKILTPGTTDDAQAWAELTFPTPTATPNLATPTSSSTPSSTATLTGPTTTPATTPPGAPAGSALAGFAVTGPVKILDELQPTSGPATVERVQVPLTGDVPGSPQAAALAALQSTAGQDAAAVTTDTQAVTSRFAALNAARTPANVRAVITAQAALKKAQATLTAAQTAATTAAQGAGSAIGVYDVAFNAQGLAVAWAPADYLVGQS